MQINKTITLNELTLAVDSCVNDILKEIISLLEAQDYEAGKEHVVNRDKVMELSTTLKWKLQSMLSIITE